MIKLMVIFNPLQKEQVLLRKKIFPKLSLESICVH